MRLTTHNTFTDVVTVFIGVAFICWSVYSVAIVFVAAAKFISGAIACAPSL